MPYYVDSPNYPAPLAMDGVPCYLFGSFNYHQADTLMRITNVSLTGNVGALTVQIASGEVPLVGSLITVSQTTTSTGLFNVNRATVTAVNINATTGAGTISYALIGGNVGAVADSGTAIAEVPEIPDAVAAGTAASIACCFQAPDNGGSRTMTISLLTPTAAAGAVYTLQEAVRNRNVEFSSIGTIVAGTSEFVTRNGSFYRVLITGATGTGTVIAKII